MEQKDLLLGRMNDLASKAVKTGCGVSKFLTPAESQNVKVCFTHRRDVTLSFDGGYPGAERTRAVFLNPDWGGYISSELFTALQILHRPQDILVHRDVLGAVMALGIERDTVGDIIAEASVTALICLPEIGGYIMDNLKKAGRAGVSIVPIALDKLPARTETLKIKTDTVASLRLDAVLSVAFGVSRGRASEHIVSGRVSINHELCIAPDKEMTEGMVLSVRGLGRAVLTEVGGLSKKGRRYVKIGLF